MRRPSLPLGHVKGGGAKSGAVVEAIVDDRGVTAIEYTLIAALIALVFVALITQIGDFVSTPFYTIAGSL